MHRLFLVASLSCSILATGTAQERQSGDMPDAPSSSQQAHDAPASQNTIQSSAAMVRMLEKKSRVFPDLATGQKQLSGWDKCKLAANSSVAPTTIGAALLGSAIGQVRDAPGGYGQESGGYGKRFGADLARSASYNAFGPCLIASATHEDPRFFVRNQIGIRKSLIYAAVRLVMTRSDAGEQVVNYSGLVGTLAAEALANTYYPAGSRGVGSVFIRYSTDMATRYGGHLLRQYLPLIDRKLQLSPP